MSRVTAIVVLLVAFGVAEAETVRLKATADVWVSAFPKEEGFSAGKYEAFKLKSIQELAAIRFDAAPAAGREVLAARLLLRPTGENMLRYVRVSTVNADWVEGANAERLSAGDGASFNHADNATKRPWAWTGSQMCDVIMTAGNSLATWSQRKRLADGWVSVALTPELIHALVAGDSDGLAVMDGGTPKFLNNFVHSVQSKSPPYIEVDLGGKIAAAPAPPKAKAAPDPAAAHMTTGAIAITIAEAKGVFCWRLRLGGKPVPRWRVKHPVAKGPTTFTLDELEPGRTYKLEIVAVSPGGAASKPTALTVAASPALARPPVLGKLTAPAVAFEPAKPTGKLRVWACPPLVKISPTTGKTMHDDVGGEVDYRACNAVWRGGRVVLSGARGEYVSYQLVIENLSDSPVRGITVRPGPLASAARTAIGGDVEVYRNWYAKNKSGKWQPAYCVPLKAGAGLTIPDPQRLLAGQSSQTVYVELYIPKDARPGRYRGAVAVGAAGEIARLPVTLEVADFALPDELCFWPQLNTYSLPMDTAADFYRLAQRHRSVMFYRNWRPKLKGSGKDIEVVWDEYDRRVGPLLTGSAFKSCRRAGVPVEAISLPYFDSWPTPLTKRTYNYPGYWPGKGDKTDGLIAHYLTAPYIADALSADYKAAFTAVQRQFVEHFKAKGYDRTEMQCLFVGKNTHRTNYGVNMWWTTDEPYHWDDWLALRFFGRLWAAGRRPGEQKQWVFRGDVSRPQWQGAMLNGAVDVVHFGTGASTAPAMIRRCRALAAETPLAWRTYGSANADNASNLGSVVWILTAWLNGSKAALPWQAMGNDKALDTNDSAVGGNALVAPGKRFGLACVADIRLKAFRDAEQIVEYLNLVERRYKLTREQTRAMVAAALNLKSTIAAGAAADNADALRFGQLKAWQLAELRRALAALIVKKPGN